MGRWLPEYCPTCKLLVDGGDFIDDDDEGYDWCECTKFRKLPVFTERKDT